MTVPIQPVPQAPPPSSADADTAAAAVSTNGEPSNSTKISSIGDLKTQAPKVYYQMMVSIATSMIKSMHKRDQRLKEMWREARNSNKV